MHNSEFWYIHGLVMADGSMRKTPLPYCVLYSSDEEIIVKVAGVLKREGSIRSSVVGGGRFKKSFYLLLGREFSQRLWDTGVRPNKSKIWSPFDVPDEFFWHWLRGFTDGDGCISRIIYRRRQFPQLCWTFGVREFADWLVNKLRSKVGTNASSYHRKDGCYSFHLACELARSVLHLMYEDATLFMDRKMVKYRGV